MKIQISNLTDGIYYYDFTTTQNACGIVDQPIFSEPIYLKVTLQKLQQNFVLDISLQTIGSFCCDRCLKHFHSEITSNERFTYTINSDLGIIDKTDIRLINPHTAEIDLKEDVREMLVLAIPQKILCSDECKGICAGCGADLNTETCRCQAAEMDPRWIELKKLIKTTD